jgi:hypothetical protein
MQRVLHNYAPQLSILQERTRSLNEHLSDSYTPLQLVAITSVVTAVSIGVYRFLFSQDEGKIIEK